MELTEVSEIQVKLFSMEDISEINASIVGTTQFDQLNMHQKLDLLKEVKERFSYQNPSIGLGDAFEKAMNEMYNGHGDVAVIVETRVLTLDKTIQRKAIRGSF